MNRFVRHHETDEFLLGTFDHPSHEPHADPVSEASDSFSINLVQRGTFSLLQDGREHHLQAGDILLMSPINRFRIRHPLAVPDDECLTLTIRFPESRAAHALARRIRSLPVRRAAARCRFILRMAERRRTLTTGVEAALLQLCSDLLASEEDGTASINHAAARKVQAACAIFEAQFAQPLSLGGVARSVGLSPFHFARLFAQATGLPPHRFLVRIRLLHAFRALLEGASVTDACFGSGFSHLSHFGLAFQDAFGVLPSKLRYMRAADSKKLIARSWLRP